MTPRLCNHNFQMHRTKQVLSFSGTVSQLITDATLLLSFFFFVNFQIAIPLVYAPLNCVSFNVKIKECNSSVIRAIKLEQTSDNEEMFFMCFCSVLRFFVALHTLYCFNRQCQAFSVWSSPFFDMQPAYFCISVYFSSSLQWRKGTAL